MVLDGELDLIFFDEQGRCEQRISLCANGETSGVEIPPTVCMQPPAIALLSLWKLSRDPMRLPMIRASPHGHPRRGVH